MIGTKPTENTSLPAIWSSIHTKVLSEIRRLTITEQEAIKVLNLPTVDPARIREAYRDRLQKKYEEKQKCDADSLGPACLLQTLRQESGHTADRLSCFQRLHLDTLLLLSIHQLQRSAQGSKLVLLWLEYGKTVATVAALRNLHLDTLLILFRPPFLPRIESLELRWIKDAENLLKPSEERDQSSEIRELCNLALRSLAKRETVDLKVCEQCEGALSRWKTTRDDLRQQISLLIDSSDVELFKQFDEFDRERERLNALYRLHELRLRQNSVRSMYDPIPFRLTPATNNERDSIQRQPYSNRLWAVLIGINKYHDRPLRGAVEDVKNMKSFLRRNLGVPPRNIQTLRDGQATRTGILTALYNHLVNNTKIKTGDPILIYYSGHGVTYPLVEAWPDVYGGSVEALCPYDRGHHTFSRKTVLDISDREFHRFLHDLRSNKGDNITVILDCCHSSGMPRPVPPRQSHAQGRIRTIAPLPGCVTDMLQHAAANPRQGVDFRVLLSDWSPDLTNCVFLMACQDFEYAWETNSPNPSGRFTSALIEALNRCDLSTATYRQLIDTFINSLDNQKPGVAGARLDHRIFNLQ